MAQNLKVCEIDPDLLKDLKKLRFNKNKENAAIVMKISADQDLVMRDEDFEEVIKFSSVDDLAAELPDSQPRYVALSYTYTHDDGHISYPLCFIFISPCGCKPEQQMMYAGSKLSVVNAGGFSKVFEVRSVEELNEEWLQSKLGFFR